LTSRVTISFSNNILHHGVSKDEFNACGKMGQYIQAYNAKMKDLYTLMVRGHYAYI